MAWVDQGMDNEAGLRVWFNPDTGETKYGQYNSSLAPDAFDANGTMLSTGYNPNMAVPQGGFTVGQAVAPNYLNSGVDLSNPSALAAAVRDVAPKYNGPLDMKAQIPVDQMRAPAKGDAFENLLGAGAMAGLGYLSGGFGLGSLFEGGGMGDWFSNLFGNNSVSPDMNWADSWGDIGGLPNVNTGPMMPPAIPETTQQLTDWGLKEVSPGVWSQPAMPDIKMGAGDWLKYGSQLLGNSLGGQAASGLFGSRGSGLFGGLNTGSLLGGGLGALLGAMNGTKKIDDAVTTESGYNSVLSPAAQDEMLKTIRGDYLNPDTNPYLKQTYDRAAGEIGARLSPSFGHMEAFGQNSGWQNAYGRSLADLGTSLYGGNYNQERQRQYGAAYSAPNYTKRSSTPVYSNPLGGMFSGAMAGGLLGGKLFGG